MAHKPDFFEEWVVGFGNPVGCVFGIGCLLVMMLILGLGLIVSILT